MLGSSIIKVIFDIFRFVGNFIITNIADPMLEKFFDILPNTDNYLTEVSSFLSDYFFKGAKFARDIILNVTGYPLWLFQALMYFLAAKFVIMVAFFGIKHILNAISLIRSGKSSQHTLGGLSK